MSENAIPQASTELPAGDPNPNETPPASNPSSLAPEPGTQGLESFRYAASDDVPTWLQGKTATEAAKIANDLYVALQRGDSFAPSPSPSTPEPHVTTPSDDLPAVDHSLAYADPAAYQRQLDARAEAVAARRIAAERNAVLMPMSSMARTQVLSDPDYREVFDRYGPEVEKMISNLPETARARPEIWREAADMVAGRHRKELARLEAERIISASRDSGSLQTQAGTANQPIAASSPLKALFESKDPSVRGFLKDDIPIEKVRSHYLKMGYKNDEEIVALLQRKPRAKTS